MKGTDAHSLGRALARKHGVDLVFVGPTNEDVRGTYILLEHSSIRDGHLTAHALSLGVTDAEITVAEIDAAVGAWVKALRAPAGPSPEEAEADATARQRRVDNARTAVAKMHAPTGPKAPRVKPAPKPAVKRRPRWEPKPKAAVGGVAGKVDSGT